MTMMAGLPEPDFSKMSEEEQMAYVLTLTDPNRQPTPPRAAAVVYEDQEDYEVACAMALSEGKPIPERRIREAPRRGPPKKAAAKAKPPSPKKQSGWGIGSLFSRMRVTGTPPKPVKEVKEDRITTRDAAGPNVIGVSPAPLKNNKNTCYMNSVLQALFACEDFTIGCEGMFAAMVIKNNGQLPPLPALAPFVSFCPDYQAHRGSDNPLCLQQRLVVLKRNIGVLLPHFVAGENTQEDAGELMQNLVGKIGENFETLGAIGIEMNPVDQFFRFGKARFRSCPNCSYVAVEAELATMNIILPPDYQDPNDSVRTSIQQMVDFTYLENSESTPQLCPSCRKTGQMDREGITTMAKYIVLQVPRFAFSNHKMMKKVILEPSILLPIFDPISGAQVRSEILNLRAFVVHEGRSPNSGHYTAVVRNPRDEFWYLCNDSIITKLVGIPVDTVIKSGSYLCIYEK